MIKKSEFIWNSLGSIVAAMLNAVLLLCCTRINGIEAAGIFSIAFATSTILNAIGDYGIRVYQVTDSKRKYQFGEYLALRIIVVAIMLVVGIAFVFISGYHFEKLMITILFIGFRLIDNLSETYQGEFQVQGRLDLGGKSVVIRNLIAIVVFAFVDMITKNILLATTLLTATNLILFIFYDLRLIPKFNKDKVKFNQKVILAMLKECFPVFLSTILSLYIMNAVKYAIDFTGNNEMQTFYNIIYLPAFTINLASLFIIKPMLKILGELWNEKKYQEMKKMILKVTGLIIIVTFLIILVCLTIGLPILSWIYGVELHQYLWDLEILVLSGGFYAISVLFLYLLTTIRKQKLATIAYIISSLIAFMLPNFLVKTQAMRGASISNLIITFSLASILVVFYRIEYQKNKKG